MGGTLGLLVAIWGTAQLVALGGKDLPRSTHINIDMRVLGFTLVVSILTIVIFGLIPSLQSSKVDLKDALKEGGRGDGDGANRTRLSS